jgi:hypothetical protein
MKSLLAAVLSVCCITFFSCQKEVDGNIVNGGAGSGGGNTGPSGTLRKLVIHDGSDSAVYNFFYNKAGKILGENIETFSSGVSEFNNQYVERNSQGMIQKVITKASQFAQFGIDSLIAIVSSSNGRYTNKVLRFGILGDTASVTTIFFYDANGRIVSQKDYVDDGSGDIDSARTDYTYTGSNLSSIKIFDLNTGSSTPDLVQTLEYDAKTSPLVVGNEAFILNNFYSWYSTNNFIKETAILDGDPVTHIQTWTYTYNASNKPVTVSITQDGETGIAANYYYY